MKLKRWATIFGTGTAMLGAGVGLGACGGYSNLGDLPGHGGEGGASDGTGAVSMGAKGGKGGKGGTGMGATGNVGTGATGGTGMGATGNVGMGATGGTGMGATGNVGMGATGGTGMGATGNVGMGAFGGTGMGATGGTGMGGTGGACMVADECPQPPPYCGMCVDGRTPCAHATCDSGVCGIAMPTCEAVGRCDPDAVCGDPCTADGAFVCNPQGFCVPGPIMCSGAPSCSASSDCIATDICIPCGDGCARAACVDDSCQMVCAIGTMCSTDMDCTAELPDNVCTTGPWRCTDGVCSRLPQNCMAP